MSRNLSHNFKPHVNVGTPHSLLNYHNQPGTLHSATYNTSYNKTHVSSHVTPHQTPHQTPHVTLHSNKKPKNSVLKSNYNVFNINHWYQSSGYSYPFWYESFPTWYYWVMRYRVYYFDSNAYMYYYYDPYYGEIIYGPEPPINYVQIPEEYESELPQSIISAPKEFIEIQDTKIPSEESKIEHYDENINTHSIYNDFDFSLLEIIILFLIIFYLLCKINASK